MYDMVYLSLLVILIMFILFFFSCFLHFKIHYVERFILSHDGEMKLCM